MRKFFLAILLSTSLCAVAQEQDMAFLYASNSFSDSSSYVMASSKAIIVASEFAQFNLNDVLAAKKAVKKVLGFSKSKKPIEAYYFPGQTAKKALIIGGVHGSELSSIEIAQQVIARLLKEDKPFYSVIVIPSLFPDNAHTAAKCKFDRIAHNTGRYSHDEAIDPNRQLPTLGQPFYVNQPLDAYGREIEAENRLLLQLIQAYEPDRIVALHAIRDYGKAGVYADPRTDCEGRALGFASDSALAVAMAGYIAANGGNVHGNKIKTSPTAQYYLDPKPAPQGSLQERNLTGANKKGKISGVSLGSWASTAVCDEVNNYQRKAARILTVEFPGYKRPSEYKFAEDKKWYSDLIKLYGASVTNYFLGEYFVEDDNESGNKLAAK